jgi:hypothetical protein
MLTCLSAGRMSWLFCCAVLLRLTEISIGDDAAPVAPHKVVVELKVIELNTTKLRRLGFDWQQITPSGVKHNSADPLTASIHDGGVVADGFAGFLEALRQNDLARVLAEPTLVTLDGRTASFDVGGYTKLDILPIVLGNGRVRLEYRIEIGSSTSQAGSSVTRLDPLQKAAPLKLDSASEFEFGKMRLVGRSRSNAPFANGKPQESETLVLVRVDLMKSGSLPTAVRDLRDAEYRELAR